VYLVCDFEKVTLFALFASLAPVLQELVCELLTSSKNKWEFLTQ